MKASKTKCQFLNTGRKGGKKGDLCLRPPNEHCDLTYAMCNDRREACKKVHHAFQSTYRCPTCGSRERQTAPPPRAKQIYCDNCDGVGWYERGKTLRTTCEKCGGTGVLKR